MIKFTQRAPPHPLQAMHEAHQLLQHEASHLAELFPPGLSMAELSKRAAAQPHTAGAPDVLNFLRNHVSKV